MVLSGSTASSSSTMHGMIVVSISMGCYVLRLTCNVFLVSSSADEGAHYLGG
jgi:hypothetical protein